MRVMQFPSILCLFTVFFLAINDALGDDYDDQVNDNSDVDITFPDCGLRSPKVSDRKKRDISMKDNTWSLLAGREKREYELRSRRQLGLAEKQVIVGGVEAKPNSWPWMVALFRTDLGDVRRSFCGGSLISRQYVLTAAHCVDLIKPSIYLAVTEIHNVLKHTQGVEHKIEEIILHPGYIKGEFYNDIALLKLKTPVKLNKKAYPVCLPSKGQRKKTKLVSNTDFTVTGWGKTSRAYYSNSPVLREVNVKLDPLQQCNKTYSVHSKFLPDGITNSMICAGNKNKNKCQGDSGGPLVAKLDNDAWLQIGVVSFGVGCQKVDYPGVYARVSYYTKWIHDNTDLGKK